VSATTYTGEKEAGRPAHARLRRLLRMLGTLLIVAGVGALAWAAIVWRWEDPFTSLYTAYQQHKLEQRYEKRVASFAPVRAEAPMRRVAPERAVAAQARRYRASSKRGVPLGRIKAPRLDLNMILVNGTDSATLKKGPARDERTFMPGEGKLVYVAGHRTTYSAPFARIDAFRAGDRVTVELPYATFVYRVTGHVIVPADAIERLRSRGREELALQACHPRFLATQRYIVYARPVRVIPRGGLPAYSPTARGRATSRPPP
jgi:sortase A